MESLKSLMLEDKTTKESLKSLTLADGGDITWQILLRLPMKQLFCCKSVCKSWNSIVSNPCFRSEYCRGLPADGGFFSTGTLSWFPDSDPSRVRMSYFPANDSSTKEKEFLSAFDSGSSRYPKKAFVIASSRGLLLCMRRSFLGSSDIKIRYFVCCPLTKEWLTIALPPNCNHDSIDGFISHEEDSATDTTTASKHHHYEIVRILTSTWCWRSLPDLDFLEIETYSSRNCQWVTDRLPFPSGLQSLPDPGNAAVFAQGVFYWLVNNCMDFMSYDPANRPLQVLPLPPYISCIMSVSLGTLREGALCCCRWESRKLYLELWVFNRHSNSSSEDLESPWLSIYKVHLNDVCNGKGLFINDVLISDILDALVIDAVRRSYPEVLVYGLSSKKLETDYVFGDVLLLHIPGDLKYCNYQKPKWPRQL